MAQRSKIQQQIVEALVESKAIDVEAVGRVLATHGSEALVAGENIGAVISARAFWACGFPLPFDRDVVIAKVPVVDVEVPGHPA